jgi:hypothetical protein
MLYEPARGAVTENENVYCCPGAMAELSPNRCTPQVVLSGGFWAPMVERFNGRISDIVDQTRYGSAAELESTLRNYVKIYNHNIPQRALKLQTPVQALKEWQATRPELFTKRVHNQAGLDT